jgi:hypothetical protein
LIYYFDALNLCFQKYALRILELQEAFLFRSIIEIQIVGYRDATEVDRTKALIFRKPSKQTYGELNSMLTKLHKLGHPIGRGKQGQSG